MSPCALIYSKITKMTSVDDMTQITIVLIQSYSCLLVLYSIFRLCIGMRIYMNLKVYILPPLNLIFSQAMLKIVVYQMLIVTNVPVNSAAL